MGGIPVAPSTPADRWHVAVVWPPEGSIDNDLFGWLPLATPFMVGPVLETPATGPGAMTAFPWARYNRDSLIDGTTLESISLAQTLDGYYRFALYTPAGVNYLRTSYATAFVYRGTTLVKILPITTTGSGEWWYIGKIKGTTFQTFNIIGGYPPGAYNKVTGTDPETGKLKISLPKLPQEHPWR